MCSFNTAPICIPLPKAGDLCLLRDDTLAKVCWILPKVGRKHCPSIVVQNCCNNRRFITSLPHIKQVYYNTSKTAMNAAKNGSDKLSLNDVKSRVVTCTLSQFDSILTDEMKAKKLLTIDTNQIRQSSLPYSHKISALQLGSNECIIDTIMGSI